jgi:chemotaxis signal transduction protein
MMEKPVCRLPFVVFRIQEGWYAVATQNVREILRTPTVTSVPEAPPEVRGVFNLRGRVLKLIDLRVKLGFPPLRTELAALIQLLCDREQDHRQWLTELDACIREHRPFRLSRDPHQCKFGRWYDRYQSQDRLLRLTLPAMDAPHKSIHATADQALRLAERGDTAEALDLIETRRNSELAALVKLFEESRRTLRDGHREVTIVMSQGANGLAFSVDSVEATEHLPEETIEPLPLALSRWSQGNHCFLGRRPKSDQTVLILQDTFFFASDTRLDSFPLTFSASIALEQEKASLARGHAAGI